MITVLFADNEEKIKEMLSGILYKEGNVRLYITKHANIIRIARDDEIKNLVSVEDKIIEIIEPLCMEKKGMVYKLVMEIIERHLFEHALQRAEGNQFKAARILGINRNTMHAKIKKLGIDAKRWKI